MTSKFKLILGLGNPGHDYEYTYHNTGILATRHFTGDAQFTKDGSSVFEYAKKDRTIIASSLVFMNESGRAAKAALERFRLSPAEILVIHDESDMPLGAFKFSFNRNAAGHHGVESVIASLGTKAFTRLRIGIRGAGEKTKASDLVLRKISKENLAALRTAFDEAMIVIGSGEASET